MGNEIKFKPATFYLGIVDHLAKAVEGLKPEDLAVERNAGDQGAKHGHGELQDGASQVETGQANAAVEGLTELSPTKEPNGKWNDNGQGLATTPDSATSTSLVRKLDSNTPLPQRESEPKEPRPIPTHKTMQ